MDYRIRTRPQEWPCTKFCRIALDEDSIVNFIDWLCDHAPEQIEEYRKAHVEGKAIEFDPVEYIWGWDAPRQRMAKLLWQYLSPDTSDHYFHGQFTFGVPPYCEDYRTPLQPIQDRLKWVMAGLQSRQEEDRQLGQADWGEQWWLPEEQTSFVRRQLEQTQAQLIEQSSSYEYAVSHSLNCYVQHCVGAIALPCYEPCRVYVGERRGPYERVFVWVEEQNGTRYPLRHGRNAYLEADGTGFEWGYPGHGPGQLARCMLSDALDGDLRLAEELGRGFFEAFLYKHSREENLQISRLEVLQWVREVGRGAEFDARRQSVLDSVSKHASIVAERQAHLARLQATGGLRSQRFDVVPKTFEAALYLDLMHMLERGGYALRCSGCGLPMPFDASGRANRQRARFKKGLPVYHPLCLAENGRKRKTAYWKRRSESAEFREAERRRAEHNRKQE